MGYGQNEHVVIRTDFPEISAQLADNANKMVHPLLNLHEMKMVAHRGLASYAPENTLEALHFISNYEFEFTETDVMVTSDGQWVIFHDTTVDRMTDGTGDLRNMTLTQVQALTIDTGSNIEDYANVKIPTLDSFLTLCKKRNLTPFIEQKYEVADQHIATLVTTIQKYGMEKKCVVLSYSTVTLNQIRAINKSILLGYVVENPVTQSHIDACKTNGYSMIACTTLQATKSVVDLIHSQGIFVNAWTATTRQQVDSCFANGVDFVTADNIIL